MSPMYCSFVVGNATLVQGPPSVESLKYKGDRRAHLRHESLTIEHADFTSRYLRVKKFGFEFQKGLAYKITQSWGLSTGYAWK